MVSEHIAVMLSRASIGASDIASPNHRLLHDVTTELGAQGGPTAAAFWVQFTTWYVSKRPFWPSDGQFTRSWSAPQINHFFLTARLNPYVVGCILDEEAGVVLTHLVTAALQGLLIPCWALLCPWCSQSVVEVRALASVPAEATCFLCQVTFEQDLSTNVVITFQMHPKVHTVPINNLPCPLPLPMQKRYLCEVLVGPTVGCAYDVTIDLAAGEYVLCCPLSCRTAVLKITGERQDGEDVVAYAHPAGHSPTLQPEEATARAGTVRITITNWLPTTLTRVFLFPMVVLRDNTFRECARPPYITAFQLMHHPLWAPAIFAPPTPEQLMFASQCFMVFADVSLPDSLQSNASADTARQECLAMVAESAARHCGMVCEQAGDAVLSSFLSGLQALVGTMEAMVRISHSSHPCSIRAGVHCGAAMVEFAGEHCSFAGKEVGRTTLFHDVAEAWQVVVSQAVFTLADLSTAVRSLRNGGAQLTVHQRTTHLQGVPDPQAVYVITTHCEGMMAAHCDPACYHGCSLPTLAWDTHDPAECAPPVTDQQVATLQARVQELQEAHHVERERNQALLQEMEEVGKHRRPSGATEAGAAANFSNVVEAIQQLQTSVANMEGQTGLQAEVQRLSQLVGEGVARVQELETGVMRVNARLTARKSVHALESEHEALRQLLSGLMSQKASLQYELETLWQEGDPERQQAVDGEGVEAAPTTERLQASVQAKAELLRELKAEVERLTAEVEQTRADSSGRATRMSSQLGGLQASLCAADAEESSLLAQLAEMQLQLAEGLVVSEGLRRLEGQLGDYSEQLKELVALRTAQQATDKRVADLQTELQQTRRELDVRMQRLAAIEAELGELQGELRHLVMEAPGDLSAPGMAEVLALREALAESDLQRQQLHEAVLLTRSLYDQIVGQKHDYTATLQSQVRKLEEMIEDNNDEREAEHTWLLRHTELDFQRLCEEKAQLMRELQRIQGQDPKETGSEYLQMMEKYRAYVEERQK